MRILCTNDDGYLAPGIRVLTEAAREIGTVEVVAPDREQSACSNALTIHQPLRARKICDQTTIVDGTPTDCVILALSDLLEDVPDLCVSGINHGPNMGEDVLYSGTVAAAMEATILGVPAVALSHVGHGVHDLGAWLWIVVRLLRQIMDRGVPPGEVLNINLPAIPPRQVRGVRVTNLGTRRYLEAVTHAPDPSGREYYWIGGGRMQWDGGPQCDYAAVRDGYISVTPIQLDLTSHRRLDDVRAWNLQL